MNANAPFSCVIAEDERIFRDALTKLLAGTAHRSQLR